jgi:hypothetical protein
MNTYNISVRGVNVIEQIAQEDLQKNLKLIRGLVWTSGGGNEDITVILNKNEVPCNE